MYDPNDDTDVTSGTTDGAQIDGDDVAPSQTLVTAPDPGDQPVATNVPASASVIESEDGSMGF